MGTLSFPLSGLYSMGTLSFPLSGLYSMGTLSFPLSRQIFFLGALINSNSISSVDSPSILYSVGSKLER